MTPHYYHGAQPGRERGGIRHALADELEELILAEGPDTVAAFLAEPVMGAGGVIVPPRGYFEKIQAVLRKYDVLFVADEVICGFWRTGNYWGSQTLRIAARHPDLRQGAVVVVPADLRGDGERAGVPGAGQGEPRDRHLRPWLHLFRPSGAGGGRARDAEDLRGAGHRRPCRAGRRRICRRSCAGASPTIRWSARCAASA